MPRWDLAERIQEWVHPTALNVEGRLARALVPGHEGRQYATALDRQPGRVLVRCCEKAGEPCKGNTHALCYHGLATVLYAIRLQGLEPTPFDTEAEAQAAGGTVVRVASAQGPGEAFLSVKPLSPKGG